MTMQELVKKKKALKVLGLDKQEPAINTKAPTNILGGLKLIK